MGSRTQATPAERQSMPFIGNQLQKLVKEDALDPGSIALTSQEEVMLKDTWNKFVTWRYMGMEALVSRLYQEDSSIRHMLGDYGDEIEEALFGMLDAQIKELQPHTERDGRNASCPFHKTQPPQRQSQEPRLDDYLQWFTHIGWEESHWALLRVVWQWALAQSPILESYEERELQKDDKSSFFRFFTKAFMAPLQARHWPQKEKHTNADAISQLRGLWDALLTEREELLYMLAESAIDEEWSEDTASARAEHWLHAWESWFAHGCKHGFNNAHHNEDVREQGRGLASLGISTAQQREYGEALSAAFSCLEMPAESQRVLAYLLEMSHACLGAAAHHEEWLYDKATTWLEQLAQERQWSQDKRERRRREIRDELRDTGSYTHTFEELEHGARVAWRNAYKCIGRVNWNKMIVRDRRDVVDPDAMYQELQEHLKMATSGENIEIVMTVFRAKEPLERWGPRLWNTQFARYAAYEQPDGSILGDQANLSYTQQVLSMGWQPPSPKTQFDLLPHVIHIPGQAPQMYELSAGSIAEVHLEHPDYPAFASLGLRWCSTPVVCNIGLDLGGLRYTCAPFNGWFMGTEIARDLFDTFRYDKAEEIAKVLGLNTSSEQTLWRDRAFVELNVAILYSFQRARVTLVDHHTASRQFMTHDRREKQAGRECPARWSWVVPPMSGSVTDVFHHEMREFHLDPKYREMANRWEVEGFDLSLAPKEQTQQSSGNRILVLFGSESGTAENFAYQAGRRLKQFYPMVKALNDCTPKDLDGLDMLLIITSTFGDGDLPQNAEIFARWLESQPNDRLHGISYGVMGLGNSIYEHYCAAGVYFNQLLQQKGAYRFIPLHKGDELRGQTRRFNTWLERIGRVLQIDGDSGGQHTSEGPKVSWLETPPEAHKPLQTRWVRASVLANEELITALGERSTRHIVFDADTAGLSYEAGDHLSVYPTNDPSEVEQLCELLGLSPDAWFTVEGAVMPFAVPATPRRVLAEELDISLIAPQQKLLKCLKESATDADERKQLAELLAWKADETTPHPIAHAHGTLSGLLRAYPSARPGFAQLLSALPRLKPRLYSISSSPWLRPNEIHLTVGVLHVETGPGTTTPGLCSHYLAARRAGDTIRVLVRPSDFCPPDDLSSTMLLVGPGTGIAPLRGFLEHREAWYRETQNAVRDTHGPAWLYFGCREPGEQLYEEQLGQWRDDGIIERLEVAFSRTGKRKQYVQHKMKRQHKTLWRLVSAPDCHIFICGDTNMAEDVLATLEYIAEHTGQLSSQAAQDFFTKMKRERRYLTDVWSSVAKTP